MKGFKRQFRKIWNIILTLVMLLSSVALSPVQADVLNPTILSNLDATVTQNDIEIAENGTIDSTEPIKVEISFGIPVLGDFDDPVPVGAQYVRKGDTVTLQLSNAFTLLSSSSIELNMGTIKVGTASFATDPITKMVTATITFDGDDEVFDGTSNTVTAQFIADFEFDADAFTGGPGDYIINILEKEFTLNVPPLPITYDVIKSGTVDLATQSILWTVNLSALQGSNDVIDLAGLEFFDNLQSVGTYIADSFTVNSVPTPIAITNNQISYVFPEGTNTPTTITFKTQISDTAYYATSQQSVTNTAVLRETIDLITTILDQDPETVTFTPPNWISKSGVSSDAVGGVYNPANRTITWTITANPAGASLNNVIITDALPSGLTFNQASWQTWNGSGWDVSTPITPNGSNEYSIGNITSMIRLIIVSNVPDQTNVTGTTTYNNSANIVWDGLPVPAISTGNVPVTVGYNAISKSGVRVSLSNQLIRWTVNVDARGQSIPELKVYDLLVYGNSITLSTVTGLPVGLNAADLTPRYGQKYASNFVGSTGLSENVIGIFQGATRVADLIEVTGLSTTEINSFSFDSQVVDPNVFIGTPPNNSVPINNTASLFSDTIRLNAATGTVAFVNRMLDKRMLNRTAMANPAAGVNNSTTNALNGFNYIEKTAIFRLSINADGIDLTNTTNANGTVLGTVTVTDTLPTGWEFVEVVPGSDYLIFQGFLSGGMVNASDTTPDTVAGLSAVVSGSTATFTFQTLNQPYVVLVKAKVTDEVAEQYFSTNQTISRTNTANLRTENWTPGINETQVVTINSNLLSKTTLRPTAGELQWTVNYQPYNTTQPVDRIEDTLPVGIDLRMNSSGTLVIAGNITMHEMSLNSDGSYTLGSEVPLVLGTNINYNNSTRTLSFSIEDNSKAYRITYKTDITGEPGTVTNFVSLIGNDSQIVDVGTPYTILSSDGSASLLRNGWISITKTAGSGSALANVEFTLFANDDTTVIKTGRTGSDGVLTLRVIPDGTYVLRETAVPVGYTLDEIRYSVVVSTVDGTVTSSINGGSNNIRIQNFLEGTAGNLTISKSVAGEGADLTKAFDFTLNLTDAPGSYAYVGSGVPGGTISSGGTVSLSHGQSITVLGIPLNATYSVVEDDYTPDGYTTRSLNASGPIIVDATQTATFTNTFDVGNLVITKTVSGNSGEMTKAFDFVVTFEDAPDNYAYIGSGVADGTISSGDTISLTHGQSIKIIGLPMGAAYTVLELDYSFDGYTTASAQDHGIIEAGATHIASFTNTREIGNLVISKSVQGEGADTNKLFSFTFTLENNTETYTYLGNGVSNGTIKSGDTISLAHGQSITVVGLPMGVNYQVVEADYTMDGYSTSSLDDSGTIEAGTTKVAVFTNTFDLGNLTIRKTVSGNAASTTKTFNFTLTLTGTTETYRYIGIGVPNGSITSGDTVSLSHGQSITIIGLPMGTAYQVTEADYSRDGYTLVSVAATGTIMAGTTHLSTFTNTRTIGLPQTGDDSTNRLAWLSLILFSSLFILLLNDRFKIIKK